MILLRGALDRFIYFRDPLCLNTYQTKSFICTLKGEILIRKILKQKTINEKETISSLVSLVFKSV